VITVAVWVDSEGVHLCSLKNEPGDGAKARSRGVLFLGFLVGLREGIAAEASGKPAVGFPLCLGPPGLWECGNRGAISKGGGKGGKLFLVSRVSTDRHFHSLYAFVVWSNRDYRSNAVPVVCWPMKRTGDCFRGQSRTIGQQ